MREIVEVVKYVNDGSPVEGVIQSSIKNTSDATYFLYKDNHSKYLVVSGNPVVLEQFDAVESYNSGDDIVKLCNLSTLNRLELAKTFPWVNPIPRFDVNYSFGLGDRLGLASLAHLRIFKDRGVLPVLAQQSIRELNLTGRTFNDVIDSAAWAVFEADYTTGYGADGDHLKNPFEIEYAIQCGFPMITLDCSEHIKNEVANYDNETLNAVYNKLGKALRDDYEARYLGQTFKISDTVQITFDEKSLYETVLIFNEAIEFAHKMYDQFIVPNNLDFEVSIDETIVPTTPENHYFIAQEFSRKGIVVETMAPKFHGEFQKGIDYVGDLDIFNKEYVVHEAIAKHFGYRLSIHSGSDKFSVFPTIGQVSKEGWHVKTAGTNWLEALRVVAKNDPKFMLELYEFALDNLDKAKAYYVIHADRNNAIPLETLTLENVSSLLDDDMSRQVLHTTYGLILNETKDHVDVFKKRIYTILDEYFEDYADFLNKHINKHLELLGK